MKEKHIAINAVTPRDVAKAEYTEAVASCMGISQLSLLHS